MTVIVGVRMTGVAVVVAMVVFLIGDVGMRAHVPILPAQRRVRSLRACLVGSLTRPPREWIDALADGCDHETSFTFCACWRGASLCTGVVRAES
jgi:hypothetical protein